MKQIQKLLALLFALALCVGLLSGCGDQKTTPGSEQQTAQNAGESQEQEAQEGEGEQTQPDTPDGGDETQAGDDAGEEDASDGEGFTGYAVYSVGDLELTPVNEDIATMAYLSCNGKEITVPVLQNANWDNTNIAEDKTFVEITNTTGEQMSDPKGSYYCTYYSEEQEYYNMEDMAQQYSATFMDEDGTSNATVYSKVTSEDGKVEAMLIHGFYQGWEIYQYLITVDYDDEYAVLDLSFYTDDPSVAAPILDYYQLPDLMAAN